MDCEHFTNSWGYGVILISRDWIRRRVPPPFSGRCGKIVPNFAEKFDGALIWSVVVPNGATFENWNIFFQKRDNRPVSLD